MSRDLLRQATPRPWVVERDSHSGSYDYPTDEDCDWPWRIAGVANLAEEECSEADAALIVQAVNEYEALLDVAEQMEREHSHHHIPGTANCHGCELLARLDSVRA